MCIPKEQIVTKRYEKENAERKNHLQDLQTQRNKAEKDLLALKTEVLACIKGESVLPRETLAEMITAQEEKLTELENLCEAASEELEKMFATESTAAGMSGLKGHRSVGGLRASIYNAMPVAGCQTLSEFMKEFCRKHG